MSFAAVCDDVIVNETLAGAVKNLEKIIHNTRNGLRESKPVAHFAGIVPLHGESIYWPEAGDEILLSPLRAGELPHEAALRWLEERLNQDSEEVVLSPGQFRASNFVPILHVSPSRHRVVFHYVWDVESAYTLPSDWQPFLPEHAPIPKDLCLPLQSFLMQRSRSYG